LVNQPGIGESGGTVHGYLRIDRIRELGLTERLNILISILGSKTHPAAQLGRSMPYQHEAFLRLAVAGPRPRISQNDAGQKGNPHF